MGDPGVWLNRPKARGPAPCYETTSDTATTTEGNRSGIARPGDDETWGTQLYAVDEDREAKSAAHRRQEAVEPHCMVEHVVAEEAAAARPTSRDAAVTRCSGQLLVNEDYELNLWTRHM